MKLIEYTLTVPTDTTPFSIFPFACVHKDNDGHCAEHWRDFLREVKDTKHAVALGIGDYYDWLRTHAREFMRLYPHDRNSFDSLHKYREDEAAKFAAELMPIRDKLALLSKGNHHHEFADGTNDVMSMCKMLRVPYGGHGGFLRLHVRRPNSNDHITLNILYHHGEKIGGGSSIGGDINAMVKKSQGWDFDVLIVAHNHQKHGTHVPVVGVNKRGAMRLIEKPKAYIRSGCFMRGYVKDCVTYAEAAGLMNPTAIGHVRLDVFPKKDHGEGVRYTFNVTY